MSKMHYNLPGINLEKIKREQCSNCIFWREVKMYIDKEEPLIELKKYGKCKFLPTNDSGSKKGCSKENHYCHKYEMNKVYFKY